MFYSRRSVFKHWHAREPFSLDLHGFSQPVAACAVRHVFTRELGNYLPSDLKIIHGAGHHSKNSEGRLGARIERLLSRELRPPIAFERDERLRCDHEACSWHVNEGCIVVPVHALFKFLVKSKPFESYAITVPAVMAGR